MRALVNKITHGNAIFDGSTAYIDTLHNNIYNTPSITIEAWIKCIDVATFRGIISKQPTVSGVHPFQLRIETNRLLIFGIADGSGAGYTWTTVTSVNTIPLNVWTHVCITYDGTIGKMYINGELDKESNLGIKPLAYNTGKLVIGSSHQNTTQTYYFNGSIDEVKIWNYIRTPQQIKDNYKKSIQPEVGLIAYYKLDGNALDSSGNNNNGTASGNVAWSVDRSVPVIQVASFNGASNGASKITTPINPFTIARSQITLSAFVYRQVYNESLDMVIGVGSNHIALNSIGQVRYSLIINDVQQTLLSTIQIPFNSWVAVTMTYDGNTLKGYINGALAASLVIVGQSSVYTTYNFNIGGWGPTNYGLKGKLSLIRIWSKALTQQEIQSSLYSVLPPSTVGLIEQWVLNGDTKATVSAANDGTLAGGTTFIVDKPTTISDVSAELEKGKLIQNKVKLGSAVFAASPLNTSINIGNNITSDITNFTIESWVYSTGDPDTFNVYAGRGNTSSFNYWHLQIRTDVTGVGHGRLSMGYDNNGTLVYIVFNTATTIQPNKWYHIAFTKSGSSLASYINGVLSTTSTWTYTTNPTDNIFIGNNQSSYTSSKFKGMLSDFRIWNYTRTAAQIKDNFKKVLLPQVGLVGYYKLNGNALDSSGNRNHGTETNIDYSLDGYVPISKVARFTAGGGVTFTANPAVTLNSTYTLAAWFIAPDVTANQILIQNSTANSDRNALMVGSNKVRIGTWNGAVYNWGETLTIMQPNRWYHVVGVNEGGVFTIYVNGIKQAVNTSISGYIGSGGILGRSHLLEADGVSYRYQFTGSLALCQMWSKALTQKEVLDNMYKVLPASTTGLLEQWTLNGNTNATVNTANNGTSTPGVIFVQDIPKGSANVSSELEKTRLMVCQSRQPYMFNFNANNSYVNYGTIPEMNSSTMTIAFWVKLGTTARIDYIINKRAGGNGLSIARTSDNRLTTVFKTNTTLNQVFWDIPAGLLGTWMHVAYGFDAALKENFCYINGVISTLNAGSKVITDIGRHDDTAPFTIGAYYDLVVPQFSMIGSVAMVRYWNSLLSQDDVVKEMNSIKPVKITTLVDEFNPKGQFDLSSLNNRIGSLVTSNAINIPSTAPVGQRSGLRFPASGSPVPITIPHNTVFDVSTNISATAWINPTSHNAFGTILTRVNSIYFQVHSDGKLQVALQGATPSTYQQSNSIIKLNTWTHIGFTYNGSSLKLYINGIEDASITVTGTISTSNTNPLYIGWEAAVRAFRGIIANVRIWNTALIQADIQKNMYTYLPATTPNLVEQWRLNEGVGTTVYGDKGNHGTITGTATWTTPSLMNWRNKVARFIRTNKPYITVNNPSLNLNSNYTVSCWFKTSTFNVLGEAAGLVVWGEQATGKRRGLILWSGAGATKKYKIYSSTYASNVSGATFLELDTWYHAAITVDNTGFARVYLNGVLDGSGQNTLNPYTYIGTDIGRSSFSYDTASNEVLDGALDEVRIWNVVRTATEIAEDYQRSIGRHPNLVLNMNFDSTLTNDVSGFGNHGTIIGTVTQENSDNDKLLFNAPING